MGNAKTASKNNPTSRETMKDITYNGKKVKPVKYHDTELGESYMAAQYEDGQLVVDVEGKPMTWISIR